MQTLFEKVNQGNINQLDALDITLSLCCQIEDCTEFTHLDPNKISLDEDNNVSILRDSGPADCYYAAPDVVLEGAAPNKDSMWFSVGCLMFFMLNGKSYCEAYDLDPIDLAESRPNDCLVDPDAYNGRASDVICAFTSWKPGKRSEGIVKLLKLLEGVPASVTANYMINNRVVYSEQIDVREDIGNYRSGEVITGNDQANYKVLPGATVKFRPGHHAVCIPVSRANSGSASVDPTPGVETTSEQKPSWLIMTFSNASDPDHTIALRVMPLSEEPQYKLLPVSLLADTKYRFVALDFNAEGKPVGRRELFCLNIPADHQMKRAFLSIRYHVQPKGFSVVLCDQNRRALSNANHFQMI